MAASFPVFINFRGADTRKGFVSHLVAAMKRKGFNYFFDEEMVRSLDLQELFVRIEMSKIALVILSEEYTTSNWCLDELVKIMECASEGKLNVIPIFYKLDTSDVKQLQGKFGANFKKTMNEYRDDVTKILEWKKSLESVTHKFGLPLSKQSEKSDNAFLEEILEEVQKLMAHISSLENAHHQVNHDLCKQTQDQIMICARKLKIEWLDGKHWSFVSVPEGPNGENIEVAKLNEVWWLHVHGFFHTKDLTPGIQYEVVLVVKVEDTFDGWETPAKLVLVVPDGNAPQEQEVSFDGYKRNEWVDIRAGVFLGAPLSKKITFTLFQQEADERKKGLQIRGVVVRPKP